MDDPSRTKISSRYGLGDNLASNGGTTLTKSQLFNYIHRACTAAQRDHNVIENRAVYFKVNCSSAPRSNFIGTPGVCQFAIFAKSVMDNQGRHTGYWKVYRCNPNHTCTKCCKKRRAHDTRFLMTLSSSLHNYVPNTLTTKGSNEQIQSIARASNGINMKRGQALNMLQEKQNTSVHVHIGQYMLVQAYIEILQQQDPKGTFDIDVHECAWKDSDEHSDDWYQFDRLYVAFGFAKHIWAQGSLDVVVADGTFTTSGIFKHVILLAVTKDGNNRLVLLAYCICDSENERNWTYFLGQLMWDFPEMSVFMSDYDKGVESETFQSMLSKADIQFSRCVRHMIGNCGTGLKRKIAEKTKASIYGMAKARTEEAYHKHLGDVLRADEQVAHWFDSRKKLFAGFLFLSNGFSRFGNVLNNMAEQYNSIIQELRGKPILDMMIGLNAYQFRQFTLRAKEAAGWVEEGRKLTPYATEKHEAMTEFAGKRVYVPHPISPCGQVHSGLVHADTMGSSTSTIFVSVNTFWHKQQCPCLYNEEHGMPCRDTWKAIENSSDDVVVSEWYYYVWRVDSYKKAYTYNLPDISTDGKLTPATMLPPESRNNRGRPKKIRYVSQSENPKRCHSCGNFGHTQKNCSTPSTEVRVLKYFPAALKYAKETARTIVID